MGLKEKIFIMGQTYNKGDYVFSQSSSDTAKHTMYVAQSTFTAILNPHSDNNTSHWVEFTAPQVNVVKRVIKVKRVTKEMIAGERWAERVAKEIKV